MSRRRSKDRAFSREVKKRHDAHAKWLRGYLEPEDPKSLIDLGAYDPNRSYKQTDVAIFELNHGKKDVSVVNSPEFRLRWDQMNEVQRKRVRFVRKVVQIKVK